jgi:hypothetical protein
MPGSIEKSKKYLQLAAANDKRASETENAELKRIFIELAVGYRELAECIDGHKKRRDELVAPAPAK